MIDSPTHFRIEASFRGAAAHAGIRPEEGRSAILAAARAVASMPHGRLEEERTVNVGTITGGSAINIVPEQCALCSRRARSRTSGRGLVAEIVERLHEAANLPDCDCDMDMSVQRTSPAIPDRRAARR